MSEAENKPVVIQLTGRIDSNNAQQVEADLQSRLDGSGAQEVVLDAAELAYISSAGLRIILRLRKSYPALKIVNVSSEVYEILEMTGFTEMMAVEKAYRLVSVEGCEEIGRGANGTIYRIDQDNVVKVYRKANALEEIRHEREMAKLALILGIPTAISYDVVRVGDYYGSVFELLNARSFSEILAAQPEKLDWCIREYVKMMKRIHGTLVPEGKLPARKNKVITWVHALEGEIPEAAVEKLLQLVNALPDDLHMLHGDYHTKNLELQDDEVLLIDMDTLSVGHPVFEWAAIYNAFLGFSEVDRNNVKDFLGMDYEVAEAFWSGSLAAYLGTEDEDRIREVENKARLIGYIRLIGRAVRKERYNTEEGREEVALWKEEMQQLLDKTDTLYFDALGPEAENGWETV